MILGREELRELWATLSANKLRTVLTGFAVGWGVLLLVILLSAGTGVGNGISHSLSKAGMISKQLDLRSGFVREPVGALPRWYRLPFTLDEYDRVCRHLGTQLVESSPYLNSGLRIELGGKVEDTEVAGVRSNYANIQPIRFAVQGSRFISAWDDAEARKVIVISKALAQSLFLDWEQCLGRDVLVGGIGFRIVGVYEGDSGIWSKNFIPLSTMQILFHKTVRVKPTGLSGMLMLCPSVGTKEAVEAMSADLRQLLAPVWGCSAEDESILRLRSRQVESAEVQKIVLALDVFLWIIGLSTLTIGLVGVINIMQISVSERRREIGVRKALGAKPRDIIRMILTESLILTLVAGLMGLVVGVWAMRLADYLIGLAEFGGLSDSEGLNMPQLFLNPTITLDTALGAIVVMVLGGLLAGFLPARRAVRIPVVEAMRR